MRTRWPRSGRLRFTPRRSRGGSLETEDTALKRGRLDIALASVLSDAGLRVSEAVQLRWRDVLDTETGAGLVYIERSKTDQAGEGAYVAITPETLTALKQLRQDSGVMTDADAPVFGLAISQISRRVDSMARIAGLGDGYSSHSGRVGLAIRMTRRGAPLQAVQTHGRWKSPQMPARYTRGEKALEALEWLVTCEHHGVHISVLCVHALCRNTFTAFTVDKRLIRHLTTAFTIGAVLTVAAFSHVVEHCAGTRSRHVHHPLRRNVLPQCNNHVGHSIVLVLGDPTLSPGSDRAVELR